MTHTDDTPPFRQTRIARFFHEESNELFHNIVNIDLLNLEITVESDQDAENTFNEDNLQSFFLEEGTLDLCSYAQDRNEKPIFQNDIVAVWFSDKIPNPPTNIPHQINTAADAILDPNKRFNYFLSPVKFSRGLFYIIHPSLNYTVPLSSIPQPYIEVFGNLHLDKCLIPQQEPPQTQQSA